MDKERLKEVLGGAPCTKGEEKEALEFLKNHPYDLKAGNRNLEIVEKK